MMATDSPPPAKQHVHYSKQVHFCDITHFVEIRSAETIEPQGQRALWVILEE